MILIVFSGCQAGIGQIPEQTSDADSGLSWEGSSSLQKEELLTVVTSAPAWNGLWKQAFDSPAPPVDFEKYGVACVFLGHSADWLYSIGFDKPHMKDGRRVIPYYLAEIVLELAAPFKAHGQYHMQVFEKIPGVDTVLEEANTLGLR